MANPILESFVRLWADDSELRKSFKGLEADATKSGRSIAEAFGSAMRQGSALGGTTGIQTAAGKPGGGPLFPADETAKGFDKARSAARLFGTTIASEVNPAFGEFVSATTIGAQRLGALGAVLGGTLAIAALYVQRLREATDFQVKFNIAAGSGDVAGAESLFKEAQASLERFKQLQIEVAAGPGAVGGPPPFRAFFANLQLLFSAGVDELRARAVQAAGQIAKDIATFTVPTQALQAEQARLKLLTQGIGLEKAAAESSDALRAATQRLVATRISQGEVEAKLIEQERVRIEEQLTKQLEAVGKNTQARLDLLTAAGIKIADIDRRAADARKAAALDVVQIEREGGRAAAEFQAKLREAEGEDLKFRRRHVDAILGLAQTVLDTEGAQNRSLAALYSARTALLQAQTQSQIAAIREESDARQAAIQERLKGAIGDERIQLQRELTRTTQEEAAKRTEIQKLADGKGLQAAEQHRQSLLQQATALFAIQETLGETFTKDEIKRYADIARAAVAGSQTQVEALGKVAQAQKALQAAGQSLFDQTLAASDREAARLGKTGPRFVSQSSLAADAEAQARRSEETRRTFERGGRVLRTDLDLIRPAQQLKEAAAQFGNNFSTALSEAFRAATTPIKAAFEASIGEPLADSLRKMTDDATAAFTGLSAGLTGAFSNLAADGTAAFTDLATGATQALGGMKDSVRGIIDDLRAQIRDGVAEIVTEIADEVENKLVRRMQQAARAQ